MNRHSFTILRRRAERALEAIDVRNGVYGSVWGREGELYSIAAVGNRVVIAPDQSKRFDLDGLNQCLTTFLRQMRPDAELDVDLEKLLLLCEPYLERH
jgi:hypothetical protein